MKLSLISLGFLLVGAFCHNENDDSPQRTILYTPSVAIPFAPKNITSTDQSQIFNRTYYLADHSNAGIQVADLVTGTHVTVITGFAGNQPQHSASGPNGLVILPDRNELYVGDAGGIVRVIDLFTNTIVASISLNASTRADEMAYDPETHTVLVTVPEITPPKVSIINAETRTVTGEILFPDATMGLEQPTFNSNSKTFYVSIPQATSLLGGGVAQLDVSQLAITRFIPIPSCIPAGMVFGQGNTMFIGCTNTQVQLFGVGFSLVIDVSSGHVLSKIPGLWGIDQVAYDPTAQLYYAAANNRLTGDTTLSGAPNPALGVVDARTNTLVQLIPTDNITAHSFAVDWATNQLVVPLAHQGIQVYNLTTTPSCK
jgi:DNA-binding beta-propeller fold protein YncE